MKFFGAAFRDMKKEWSYKDMTFLEGETVLAPRHHGSSPHKKEPGIFASLQHGFAMIRFQEPPDTLHIPLRMVEHIAAT